MKIYTKTGDKGMTSLYDGSRIYKSEDILDILGTNDELSSHIGLLIALLNNSEIDWINIIKDLRDIQTNLQYINSIIATVNKDKKKKLKQIESKDVEYLEKTIDYMESQLPKLTVFILPGVTVEDAHAHICRTYCRKVERKIHKVLELSKLLHFDIKPDEPNDILCYINRLSDYFFSLARFICFVNGKEDFKK
jgi:cob(I)alamin adenosyltransferase